MYKIKDVADLLKVNYITIIRAIYSEKIKAIKVGNRWRIPQEEYERVKREGI